MSRDGRVRDAERSPEALWPWRFGYEPEAKLIPAASLDRPASEVMTEAGHTFASPDEVREALRPFRKAIP